MLMTISKSRRLWAVLPLLALSLALVFLPFSPVLADGTTDPSQAVSSSTTAAIATGLQHSLVLNYDGRLLTFGDNTYGELGDGTNVGRSIPTELDYPTDVVAIAAGYWHSLAVTSDGSVYAWGRNLYGQLGTGDTKNSSVPVKVEGLPPVVAVAAGAHHSLALTADGAVYAWGRNTEFEVGNFDSESIKDVDGTTLGTRVLTPVCIVQSGAIAIAAGQYFSMYVTRNGNVMAFGDNRSGQLGDGGTVTRGQPANVIGLEDVVAIAAGADHALAVVETKQADGTVLRNVWAWGSDSAGQLGQGRMPDSAAIATRPVRVDLTGDEIPGNDQVSLIAAGAGVSLVVQPLLDRTGARKSRILVFGSNIDGALGLGPTIQACTVPTPLVATSNGWTGSVFLPFEAIATSGSHTLILGVKGQLGGMGRNGSGQLGDGTASDHPYPAASILVDRISPAWNTGAALHLVSKTKNTITYSWPAACDNLSVAGYELKYIDPNGDESSVDVGPELQGTMTGIDTADPQIIRLFAYDAAGNSSDTGLVDKFVPDGMTFEQAFPTGEPDDVQPTVTPDAAPTDPPTAAAPEATSTPDAAPTDAPDVTPGAGGTVVPPAGPGWNADEFGVPVPLEGPWDVDSFYGDDVILPPSSLTPAMIAVASAFAAGLLLPALYLALRKVDGLKP